MLVWLNDKNRNRSHSNSSNNSSNRSTGKASSEKIQSKGKIQKQKRKPNFMETKDKTNSIVLQLSKKYDIPIKYLQNYYKVFTQNDQDEDGFLDMSEFQNLMSKGSQPINLITVRDILHQLKRQSQNGINFEDFIRLMLAGNYEFDSDESMENVFKSYDRDRKGYITLEDYLEFSNTISQKIPAEELQNAFNLMDTNNDGMVTLKQFKQAISGKGILQY